MWSPSDHSLAYASHVQVATEEQGNEEEENGVGDDASSWSFGGGVHCDVMCRYGARQEMER